MPITLKQRKTASLKPRRYSMADSSLFGLSVALLLGVGWFIWQATIGVTATSTTTVTTSATPALPQLELNSTHARQGQPIQVDPNNIGKVDPFSN